MPRLSLHYPLHIVACFWNVCIRIKVAALALTDYNGFDLRPNWLVQSQKSATCLSSDLEDTRCGYYFKMIFQFRVSFLLGLSTA